MNIFILDNNHQKSVRYLVEKHLTKMPLETAQILCSPFPNTAPYKRTHYNHPCCVWVRSSVHNYQWLLDYGEAIFTEFKRQRNKQHKSYEVLEWCKNNFQSLKLPNIPRTPFPLCMPDQYKDENHITAYRNYYKSEKLQLASSSYQIPSWVS